MKKILVPTDFSPNSKSGVRFAIQWASQQDIELVFIHVLNILIPTRWSQGTVDNYVAGELKACRTRFRKFIDGIYKNLNLQPGVYSTVLIQEYDPAKTILEYCKKDRSFDCVCMSTNGAGPILKLFGTNTSQLISKSSIPVLAIPKNYKVKEINKIMYASDLREFQNELPKVLKFASLFKSKVDIVHFSITDDPAYDEPSLLRMSGTYEFGVQVAIHNTQGNYSLTEVLQKQIRFKKPSLVVVFTNQGRSFFQRLFYSSKAEELSFQLKTPLLVFSKINSSSKKKQHELV